MINVYYTRSVQKLNAEIFSHFFQQLPPPIQNKISKFRNWEDSQRCLLGNALLIRGLEFLGLTYSLNNLKYTEYKRPFFDDLIDFNISHSGEYIICAISTTNKVGVDVEKMKDIPINNFKNIFSDEEWNNVSTDKSLRSFYTYWTKKEAFLKAIGTGMNIPLKNITIPGNKIVWENREWFLEEIKLDKDYLSHVSSDTDSLEIAIEKLDF